MLSRAVATTWWEHKHRPIAILSVGAIAAHLSLRFGTDVGESVSAYPLYFALAIGGSPLVVDLLVKLFRREFGSDLLAGLSISTAVILG